VDRLFSAFPSRWPGLGLLILRVSLSVAQVGTLAGRSIEVQAMLVLAAVLLAAGLLTPCVAGVLAVFEAIKIAVDPASWASSIMVAGMAAATALLGPGAYSIDARLFGWRQVVIPGRSGKPDVL
jgi:uncharacterized membrane protein YphA (DoxX/SURF4 family)